MSKVIQIRGVPDDVHKKLVEAAHGAGLSLTAFLARELARVAREADSVRHNREVIAALRSTFPGLPSGSSPSSVELIQAGRAEREAELLRRSGLPRS